MMKDADLNITIMESISTFMRLSLHDFNRFTRSAGLSLSQMIVLLHLYYQGSNEVTHFCDIMQITPAGASLMIERMVQQGLVQRVESPGDRRVRLVELTGQGREIVLGSIEARQGWVDNLVASLSEDECERMISALGTLNDLAGKMEIHPD